MAVSAVGRNKRMGWKARSLARLKLAPYWLRLRGSTPLLVARSAACSSCD